MEVFLAGLALLFAIAALGAAAGIWVTLSARINELELRVGGSAHMPTSSSNVDVAPGELPPCSPRVRLLAKTLGRKDEAIQVYRNENKVSHEIAAAVIEKLMAE